MRSRLRHSMLELREPRNGLKFGPRSSRWVCSAELSRRFRICRRTRALRGSATAKARCRKLQSA
eukprot:5560846-Alexandrium_andersonii.AAC.1